jgi:hypothetical protein
MVLKRQQTSTNRKILIRNLIRAVLQLVTVIRLGATSNWTEFKFNFEALSFRFCAIFCRVARVFLLFYNADKQ